MAPADEPAANLSMIEISLESPLNILLIYNKHIKVAGVAIICLS